jgi:hypothetical protein
MKTLTRNSAFRVTAVMLTMLTLGTSTASAKPPVPVLPGTSVTTPFTLPSGAPVKGTPLAGGRVLLESVTANGTPVATVMPAHAPSAAAKKGFWGKVWDLAKRAYRWVKKHVVIKR